MTGQLGGRNPCTDQPVVVLAEIQQKQDHTEYQRPDRKAFVFAILLQSGDTLSNQRKKHRIGCSSLQIPGTILCSILSLSQTRACHECQNSIFVSYRTISILHLLVMSIDLESRQCLWLRNIQCRQIHSYLAWRSVAQRDTGGLKFDGMRAEQPELDAGYRILGKIVER